MGKYAKPQIECPKCSRIMELVNWQNEEHTVAIVECPICCVRETKEVVQQG